MTYIQRNGVDAGTRRIYYVEPRGLVELRRHLDTLRSDALAAFGAEVEKGQAAGA